MLGLADGLEQDDLVFSDTADGVVIALGQGGPYLAVLAGVSEADIGPTDFTLVV